MDELIIHCADTPDGEGQFTAWDVDYWHELNGWRRVESAAKTFQPLLPHIGYHGVVHVDGSYVDGRSFSEIGAHAAGHNYRSIGFCLMGREQFTLAQWDTLRRVVESQLRMRPLRVIGHRDVAEDDRKTCPGFDVQAWLDGGLVPLAGHILEVV